jgi:putative CocE/NonD family hydrolase
MNGAAAGRQRVPMRDGVVLTTDHIPAGSGKPAPVVLHRTAYGRDPDASSIDWATIARAGYHVALQDVRGRGGSGGRFDPYRREADDTADTIDWLRGQPWASGEILMAGRSYGGACQWLAAAGRAGTRISAICPEASSADLYDGWTYRGGALNLEFLVNWFVDDLLADEPVDREALRHRYLREPWRLVAENRAAAPYLETWLGHPGQDSYWRSLGSRSSLQGLAIPALIVSGWRDPFLAAAIDDFTAIRASPLARPQQASRLVIGPWQHCGARRPAPTSGDPRLDGLHLQWFESLLRPGARASPRVRLHVGGALNGWRDFDDWPPSQSRVESWYLTSRGEAGGDGRGGALTPSPPEHAGSDAYQYDPRHAAPSLGDARYPPDGALPRRRNQASRRERHDVLRYTSDALASPLALVGRPRLVLFVSASVPDTDFIAKLIDVRPDGHCAWVCDAVLRARYRHGRAEPRLLRPGRLHQLELPFAGAAHVFAAGHRLRVEVTSSDYPKYDLNPNTGETGLALQQRPVRVARIELYHGRGRLSRIELPLFPLAARPGANQARHRIRT